MSEAVIESCGMHKKSTNGICLYTSGWCEGYQKSKCDDSPCDECADCRYNQFHEVQKIREDSGIEENISIRMMYQEIEDLTEELTRLKELNIELLDENEMLKEEVKRLPETHKDFETV